LPPSPSSWDAAAAFLDDMLGSADGLQTGKDREQGPDAGGKLVRVELRRLVACAPNLVWRGETQVPRRSSSETGASRRKQA
jgi:hypothetical protein